MGLNIPGVKELNESHMKKFNRPADVIIGPAYTCVQALANAIEKSGDMDRSKIRDAIAATDMKTVIGPFRVPTRRNRSGYILRCPVAKGETGNRISERVC